MNFNLILKAFLIFVAFSVLSACGGGSDEPSKPPVQPVLDTTPPVITLNGSAELTVIQGSEYVEQGASATDNIDGSLAVVISGAVDVNKTGEYTLTYTATDKAGNQSSLSRLVIVESGPDTIAPVITINGSSSVLITVNQTYSELGAVAEDDKDPEVNVVISGQVNTAQVGEYTLTYTASDSDGNRATAERLVVVTEAPFITTWDTRNDGLTEDNQIMIRTGRGDGNFYVDWGDGIVERNPERIHTYDTPGIYTVKMAGALKYFYLQPVITEHEIDSETVTFYSDNYKLLSVEQWGAIRWESMSSMFLEASNLVVNASDTPDLALVTDMSQMFERARLFNSPIADWDVSNVTNMQNMFAGASVFNQDISAWNVAKVTNMQGMFSYAGSFNQDISEWNVSKVNTMKEMFKFSVNFNQAIGNWDVSNVTDMSYMFWRAEAFNQNIGGWNVAKVTDMSSMFRAALSFNQDLSLWDVSSVTSMASMFSEIAVFNQDISQWNVANVSIMISMFRDSTSFDQNLGNWSISNVKDMRGMFFGIALSTENYDATLLGWSSQQVPENIEFNAGNSKYSEKSAAARQSLIDQFNWTIVDGGIAN